MKDVVFEGKWRKYELLDTENPPFALIPEGILFKVLVWTDAPTTVRVTTPSGSSVTAESRGELSPAELFTTGEFRKGDSFFVTVDEDAAAVTKVIFIFDEDQSPTWGE